MSGPFHKVLVAKHKKIAAWRWICDRTDCFSEGFANTYQEALEHAQLHQKSSQTSWAGSFADIFQTFFGGAQVSEQTAKDGKEFFENWSKQHEAG